MLANPVIEDYEVRLGAPFASDTDVVYSRNGAGMNSSTKNRA